ncbi:substrate-binding domain-containing protein [Allostella humosa]|uniref:substrate-binding domain-containing protein n=1 Tax=Stella humosa TaxID=94 RepID=UPI000F4CB724|nr:substrate-binding domain-containing protein [Stella humosa]
MAASVLLGFLVAAHPAPADAEAAARFLDPSLAWLAPALPESWRLAAADAVPPVLCAGRGPLSGWLALAPVPPPEFAGCARLRPMRQATLAVGRQAGVVVTGRGTPELRLDSARLHQALEGGAEGGPRSWRDIDSRLPDTPIAVLLPDAGSPLWRLLSATVLQAGCLSQPAIRRIFDAGERRARCEAVRTDGAVDRRQDGTDVTGWLAARGAGAVAVVTFAEFLALGDGVVPVALGDVLPTAAAITADRYPMSRTIHLSVGLPNPAGVAMLRQFLRLAGEETIGPAGSLAALGIVPLSAPARVELRQTLLSLGGAL